MMSEVTNDCSTKWRHVHASPVNDANQIVPAKLLMQIVKPPSVSQQSMSFL
jgi:hypothetical protein